jgi:hypothetical protein
MEKERVFVYVYAEDVETLKETLDLLQDNLAEVADETGADIIVKLESDNEE